MQTSPASTPAAPDTRDALLEAATAVFAAAGFRNATVRDICRRAGANVAAVNYHFRDKETLYLEVLRHVQRQADARHPLPRADGGLAAEARLAAFVRGFLLRLLDPGPDAVGSRLMAREMVEPSGVFDTVLAEQIQPIADEVRDILTELLGDRASEAVIRRCGISIVSQCLFYHQCRDVVRRLFPDLDLGPEGLDELARHITRFSLAGLGRIRREPARQADRMPGRGNPRPGAGPRPGQRGPTRQ